MAGNLDLRVSPLDDGRAALVELGGVLDATTSREFEAALDRLRGQGCHRVVVDFANIRYVNSTGLGMLVKQADTFRTTGGGGMAMIKVPGKVQIIMEMSGLVQMLAIREDVPQALAALASPGGGIALGSSPDPSPNDSNPNIEGSGRWRSSAARLAGEDPDGALRRCRQALERCMPRLYQKTLGDPQGRDMNALLAGLKERGIMQPKPCALVYSTWEITTPGVLPVYSSEDSIKREAYIAVASMTVIQAWFKQHHPDCWA